MKSTSLLFEMKWKTHKTIARAIAEEIGLSRDSLRSLLNGVIDPDKYPEKTIKIKVGRKGRVYTKTSPMSHHNPNINRIMNHVWKARLAFLIGEISNAAYWTGWALHYIQDKCAGKGIFGLKHESVENDASNMPVERKYVLQGLMKAQSSPRFVRRILNAVSPTTDPADAVREATLASSVIFAAIFDSKKPPEGLLEKYKKAEKKHAKISVGEGLSIFSVIILIMLGHLQLLLLPVLAGLSLYLLDGEFRELREEARWFAIA